MPKSSNEGTAIFSVQHLRSYPRHSATVAVVAGDMPRMSSLVLELSLWGCDFKSFLLGRRIRAVRFKLVSPMDSLSRMFCIRASVEVF